MNELTMTCANHALQPPWLLTRRAALRLQPLRPVCWVAELGSLVGRTLMRIVGFCLIVCYISGCATSQSRQESPGFRNRLSTNQVADVRQKIQLLRPGMTSDEALAALGLSAYRGKLLVQASGPANHSSMSYLLRDGHGLLLVCDYTRHTNGIVIRAELDGERWPNQQPQ